MSGAASPGPGPVFAIVGPSGAGKDSVIAGLSRARPRIRVMRRVITRPESLGGEDFEGVTPEVFARRQAAGDFALSWHAHDLDYGIPVAARTASEAGQAVIFNGSRGMLGQAAAVFPRLTVLMISAPVEVLAERLAGRGRESAAQIAARLARAPVFARKIPEGLDLVAIDNSGPLEAAVEAALAVISARLAAGQTGQTGQPPQALPVRG